MALELVKLDSATLPGIADAIREKTGGTDLMLPSEMRPAILAIPTGAALPELTNPAADGYVIAGKEYIDGNGNKKTGTLVVADSLFAAEVYLEGIGVGAAVTVESSVDGSNKDLTLPEPNLMPENIKSGVMIYGCTGNAKILRVETGTITPAEDITAIDIACTAGYRLFVFKLTRGAASGKAIWNEIFCTPDIAVATNGTRNANARYFDANGNTQYGILSATTDSGFGVSSTAIVAAAGCEYTWTAYYWEDT